MNTFPLLRFPFVPLKGVLKCIDLVQLVEFSLCSKKAYMLAKNVMKMKNLSLEIRGELHRTVIIHCQNRLYHFDVFNYTGQIREGSYIGTINKHSLKMYPDREHLTLKTYWEDANIGFTELAKYIADFFNYPTLSIVHMDSKYTNTSLINWINQKFCENVKEWTIISDKAETSMEEMNLLLDSCKSVKGNAWIFSKPLVNFQYTFDYNMDSFYLQCADWITMDNLIELSNQTNKLNLAGVSLTSQDWITFLKKIISSDSVWKMKELTIKRSKLNLDEIFMGITKEEKHPEGFNIYRQRVYRRGEKGSIILERAHLGRFEMHI